MQQDKEKYQKPVITRIKLNAGEAIMGTCSSTSNRTVVVKTSNTCRSPSTCRTAVS